MFTKKRSWFVAGAMLALAISLMPASHSVAQAGSQTFPQTGKTVSGRFLDYWNTHGGLAQEGYPISDLLQERSDTDGKTYQTQYFERAVFEMHPENAAPNDVLLSLLGDFLYSQKYGNNAPGQTANRGTGARFFNETQHWVGGDFLSYWNTHGGLAQQGFPISDEFSEVSSLNGQTYKVQYFERAVFEAHPENAAPYNVLLSQLGTFRYQQKHAAGNGGTGGNGGGTAQPTAKPTSPPAGTQTSCGTLPKAVNAIANPAQIRGGDKIQFYGGNFRTGENMSFWFTLPTGDVFGTARPLDPSLLDDLQQLGVPEDELNVTPGNNGIFGPFTWPTNDNYNDYPGIWAVTFQGARSGNKAVAYFCVKP